MSDRELRELLRRAQAGEAGARVALQRALARAGLPVQQAWAGLDLTLAFDPRAPRVLRNELEPEARRRTPLLLSETSQAAVAEDVENLDADALLASYPRDRQGKWPLKEQVFLAAYETAERDQRGATRGAWLIARAPERRSEPQVVSLVLACVTGKGARNRWDASRWLWDARAELPAGRRELTGRVLELLAPDGLARRRKRLEARCASGEAALAERVALAVLLQDEGKVVQALKLFEVRLSPAASRALRTGEGARSNLERTRERMVSALASCAPWRFEQLLADVPRRSGKPVQVCLVVLTTVSATASMFLALLPRARGGMTLDLVRAATIMRAPEDAWKRPRELDRPKG